MTGVKILRWSTSTPADTIKSFKVTAFQAGFALLRARQLLGRLFPLDMYAFGGRGASRAAGAAPQEDQQLVSDERAPGQPCRAISPCTYRAFRIWTSSSRG